jgi:protein-disulfide isomerase
MGRLMIRCPKTSQAIFTGKYVALERFRSIPVFFSDTYCPHCNLFHEWFAKDAWICDEEYCGP